MGKYSGHSSFKILNRYIGKEYVLSFIMSFIFFFVIYFINQILLLAQKIILKNVNIPDVLLLVSLAIPQFLMYTMPFSSLTSAAMVTGNLSSSNEILAMRASGINAMRIFRPIILISFIFSFLTYLIADFLIPYSAEKYQELYSKILQNLPTVELDSYSSTTFGSRVVSNGAVEGNVIYDVVIFDNQDTSNSKVVSAKQATITLIDLERFIYKIELVDPQILITDSTSLKSYSLATAKEMIMYLSLQSNDSGVVSITASQMSLRQLQSAIENVRPENDAFKEQYFRQITFYATDLGPMLIDLEDKNIEKEDIDLNSITNLSKLLDSALSTSYVSYYFQYYRSEFFKKLALSFACTILVLVAFPVSFVRMKYGRLFGFFIAIIYAVFYWYFLYFMHYFAVYGVINPFYLLWLPNMVTLVMGLILLIRLGRK